MKEKAKHQNYEAPTIIVLGTVDELTAGPVTPFAESPSGQKGSASANSAARAEEE
jgi:hypothetical protein